MIDKNASYDLNKYLIKDYNFLNNKTIFISGSSGLIGTALKNYFETIRKSQKMNLNLILLSRSANVERIDTGFGFNLFVKCDVKDADKLDKALNGLKVDYCINLASSTHPKQYATTPIEVILANVIGTRNLLNVCVKNNAKYICTSSVEIYGTTDKNPIGEKDYGIVDCDTLRSGYPEAKRVCESLCHAYYEEKKVEFNILRLSRIYGPDLKLDDTKAMSQFFTNAAKGNDIILKSKGEQNFSYMHSFDAARAILDSMSSLKQRAFNVTDDYFDMNLKDIAALIAKVGGVKVKFELPEQQETKGYSIMKNARISSALFNKTFDFKCMKKFDSKTIEETILSIRNKLNSL